MSTSKPLLTIREAFLQASSFLQQNGVQESAHAAELLLQYWLGLDRTDFFLTWNEPFRAEKEAGWKQLLERKAAGEPVQYLIGEQEFYGFPFYVSPDVLIPRPETEILVEHIVKYGREIWPTGSPVAVDIGTGSGAIPVAIAKHCPSWMVAASDISAAALDMAKRNAVRNKVEGRITFMQGDLLEPFVNQGWKIDILVSNPPYIASADIEALQPEVRVYEPRTALDGGEDGLSLYRRMIGQIAALAVPPRLIGYEVGQGQAQEVAAMLHEAGHWEQIVVVPDLAGIERHVIATRRVW